MPAPDHPGSSPSPAPDSSTADRIFAWWGRHRLQILTSAAVLMALAALVWLTYQTWRLLWQGPPLGAIDLRQRFDETRAMRAGLPVYRVSRVATYPPATLSMLWPILGWPSFTTARWLWALLIAGCLVWMARACVRQSGATTGSERRLAMLVPLAMYATGAAVGNGQLTVFVVAGLMASLPAILRDRGVLRQALAGLGILVALLKPSLAAPFFWMVLFRPNGPYLAVVVAAIYLGLTAVAGLFQPAGTGMFYLLHEFVTLAEARAVRGAVDYGQANVHTWLSAINLPGWNSVASLVILGALGGWTWRHRRAEPWLLMSAAAFAARFWTYHAWYDDLILIIPMIALCRLAKQGRTIRQKVWAGSLLAAMWLSTLAPGGLHLFPKPWSTIYVSIQVGIWFAAALFLLRAAQGPGVAVHEAGR
jgi:hypothetical protein